MADENLPFKFCAYVNETNKDKAMLQKIIFFIELVLFIQNKIDKLFLTRDCMFDLIPHLAQVHILIECWTLRIVALYTESVDI